MGEITEEGSWEVGAGDSWKALLRRESASLPLDERLRRARALAELHGSPSTQSREPDAPLALAAAAGLADMLEPMAAMGFVAWVDCWKSCEGPMERAIRELSGDPALGPVLKALTRCGSSSAQEERAFKAALYSKNPSDLRAVAEARFKLGMDSGRALAAVGEMLFEGPPGRVATLKELLDLGVGPEAVDYHGRPLPFNCVEHKRADALALTLAAGARVDLVNQQGKSLLAMACAVGDPECVKVLLAAGASPRLPDNPGGAPLDLCVSYAVEIDALSAPAPKEIDDYLDIVAQLMAAGAQARARSIYGESPLGRLDKIPESAQGPAVRRIGAALRAWDDARELRECLREGVKKAGPRI